MNVAIAFDDDRSGYLLRKLHQSLDEDSHLGGGVIAVHHSAMDQPDAAVGDVLIVEVGTMGSSWAFLVDALTTWLIGSENPSADMTIFASHGVVRLRCGSDSSLAETRCALRNFFGDPSA